GSLGRWQGRDGGAVAGRGGGGARPDVGLEVRGELARQFLGGLGPDVPDMDHIEPGGSRDRPGLDTALHAGAADRGDARVPAREVAGRQGGGGAGAGGGELDRMHQRKRTGGWGLGDEEGDSERWEGGAGG